MSTVFMILFGFGLLYCMYEYASQHDYYESKNKSDRKQAYKEGFISGLKSQLVEFGGQEFDTLFYEEDEYKDSLDGIDFSMANRINKTSRRV